MIEDLSDFAVFALKCFLLFQCFRMCQVLAQVYINRFFIENELDRSIVSYEKRRRTQEKELVSPELFEVTHAVIRQMTQALEYHKKKVFRHAVNEHAILFSTLIWLPNNLTDPILFDAIDLIKQKFYTMHGVYVLPKGSGKRNNIELRLQTTSGKDLKKYYDTMTDDERREFFRQIAEQENSGCNIMVHVSIINALTPKNYDYREFVRD